MDSTGTKKTATIEGSPKVTIHLWIDRLMPQLGNPGLYQIIIFVLYLVNYIPTAFNHVTMAFYGWKFPYVCDPFAGNHTSFKNVTLNKCDAEIYEVSGINKTISCTAEQWRFTKEEGDETIVTEFGLVCDREDLINLATTIYFLGVLVGGSSFGYIADRFGRKPTFAACIFSSIAFGVGIRFSPNYITFVALRFVVGFFMQGIQTVSITSYVELFQSKYRAIALCISELTWAVGELTLALIAFIFRDWKDMQLGITLPSLVVLFYIAILPESFRWLLLKSRTEEAERIVRRMSKFNKLTFPEETWNSVKNVSLQLKDATIDASMRTYTFIDLVRTPEVRKRTFIVCYFWFVAALGYYGLVFQLSDLAGDRHLNMFYSGLTSLVGGASTFFAVHFLSRRMCLLVYSLISGVSCVIAGALPYENDADVDYGTMKKSFALVGKASMMGIFCMVILFNQEIFPTVIRTMAFGTGATFGRLGALIAPQINTLGKYTAKQFPPILFGSLFLVSALIVIVCPEPRFKKLPDTIEDVENSRKKKGVDNEAYEEGTEMREKYTRSNIK